MTDIGTIDYIVFAVYLLIALLAGIPLGLYGRQVPGVAINE